MNVLVVVEDDPDVRFLVETIFSLDSRFSPVDVTETAEQAFEMASTSGPGVMVLDNALAGELSGLEAAPRLKELAPQSKIILFTAHADLQARADAEPAVDAFLLETDSVRLLPLAQRLTGVSTTSP